MASNNAVTFQFQNFFIKHGVIPHTSLAFSRVMNRLHGYVLSAVCVMDVLCVACGIRFLMLMIIYNP